MQPVADLLDRVLGRLGIQRGIRLRTSLVATAVTAVVLVGSAVLLLVVLQQNLRSNLETAVETQSRARAELIDQGAAPADLVTIGQDESLVWIGDSDGSPLAVGGSYRIVGAPDDLTVGGARTVDLLVEEVGEDERERTEVIMAVAAAGDGTLVAVGSETEVVGKTTAEVRNLLLLGLPLLVAAVALVSYRAAGRTLAPVAEIREAAERIGSGPIDSRVPVPDTDDEIQRLGDTVNAMLDRLDAQQRAQRRFTADASHELKTPVANLRAVAETTVVSDPSWPQTRDRMIAEADRLAALVDDLLFIAVDDDTSGPVQVHGRVDVDDILFDEAELIAARGMVAVDIGGVTPCAVDGDPDQLRRLVRNLVQNAERHAAAKVTLACAEDDDHRVTVVIADDGPGVPEAERTHIFDRFARLESARDRASGGAGLGLAIVAAIAARHGASVAVDDAPGGGARFTVTWG